jgi:hypothetical protein
MDQRRHWALSTIAAAVAFAASAPSPVCAQDSTHAIPVAIHGFVLVQYRSGDPLTTDGFRLRKADLKLSGPVSPHMNWRISFDAAKALTINKTVSELGDSVALSDAAIDQRTRMLQDAALTYVVNHGLSFDIGQQIIPLGLEGTYATAQIETIERTLFAIERSRAVGLGDVRDIGVSANGFLASNVVEYHVGTFNETGEGAGTTDVNPQKSIVGRLAIHPSFLPQLQFGGSGGFEGGPSKQRRERAAGEVQLRTTELTLRAEVMSARDGLLRRLGWYGLGAYRPTPRLQLVGRYDWWDRDRTGETVLANAVENQIVFGASYLIEGTVGKIALNIVHQTFPNVNTVREGTFLLAGFSGLW